MFGLKNFQHELYVALEAAHLASKAAKIISTNLSEGDKQLKKDQSPVTVADFACQMLISYHINKHYPNDLLVGEEEPTLLMNNPLLCQKVLKIVRQVSPSNVSLTDSEWLSLLDCKPSSTSSNSENQEKKYDRYWTIDPIDGTKGFLRHAQYAVCIALLINNEVRIGALACPNLSYPLNDTNDIPGGSLLFAVTGKGAFQVLH
ncbi:hypothetical protein HMI55_006951 [Coelomomyces lativittatus]|nr:hypothetical protein HMI55_006951 [Coelomomyces lativittatus]